MIGGGSGRKKDSIALFSTPPKFLTGRSGFFSSENMSSISSKSVV